MSWGSRALWVLVVHVQLSGCDEPTLSWNVLFQSGLNSLTKLWGLLLMSKSHLQTINSYFVSINSAVWWWSQLLSKDLKEGGWEKINYHAIENLQRSFQGWHKQQHISTTFCQWGQTTWFLLTGLAIFWVSYKNSPMLLVCKWNNWAIGCLSSIMRSLRWVRSEKEMKTLNQDDRFTLKTC